MHIFIFSETTGNLTGYKYVTQEEFRSNYSEFTEFDKSYKKEENLGDGINENAKVEINTLTGKSRIYAVANCGMSNYNVPELLEYLNDGSINEDAYLNGHATVTLDYFQKLTFKGNPESMVNDITVNEDDMNMLMSGGYQRGEVCTIGFADGKGAIYDKNNQLDTKPIIQLRRVLSKVKVSISLHSDNTTATFVPQNYSVYNIASEGMMLPQTDGVTKGLGFTTNNGYTYVNRKEVNYQVGNMIERETDKVQTGAWFEVIIPENRQGVVTTCDKWPMREDNTYSNTSDDASKTFTNAPAKGTYVVINGKYTDNTLQRIANATYTVHLGDFSTANVEKNSFGDFNLNRNWEYEYNVYIKNVSDIVVEAHTIYKDDNPDEPSPGAEGTVIDFGTGQAFVVDSHYEAVVMKVTKADAYSFSTEVPDRNGGKLNTGYIVVNTENGKDGVEEAFEGIQNYQHQWLEFVRLDKLKKRFKNLVWAGVDNKWGGTNATEALRKQMADLKYEPLHQKGGNVPFLAYTFTSAPSVHVHDNDIYYTDNNTPTDGDILLKGVDNWLIDLMRDEDDWTEEKTTDGEEIKTRTYICFINEHYYINGEAGVTGGTWQWNEYTNANKERYFNFLNEFYDSQDEHSKHLKVNYSIEQKAIWTFYNPYYATGNHYDNGYDGNVRAYGVEYYSDEELFDENNDGVQDRLSNGNQPNTTAPIKWESRWKATFDICLEGCNQANANNKYKPYSETGGRYNSMNDMAFGGDGYADDAKPWPQVVCEDVYMNGEELINKHYLHLAFVYRNRDLDRDGFVDQNEIRWYTPSINQYAGLWMGEGVLPVDAKLYHETSYATAQLKDNNKAFKDLSRSEVRHYFSSTPGMRTFWGEEAFSFGSYGDDENNKPESTKDDNRPSFVRCIRTIISGEDGLNENMDPDPYYVYNSENRTFDLRFIDPTVLSNTAMTTEIGPHHERLDQNKASIKFKVGKYRVGQTDEMGEPIMVEAKDGKKYIQAPTAYTSYAVTQQSENLYADDGTPIDPAASANASYLKAPASYVENGESGWRIPNHREFGLMMLESRNMEAKSLSDPNTTYTGDEYLVTSFAWLEQNTDWLDRMEGASYDSGTGRWYIPIHSQDIESGTVIMGRRNERVDACRTHCSNPWYRRGYHARRNKDGTFIMSMHGSGFNWDTYKLFIRPIKDL